MQASTSSSAPRRVHRVREGGVASLLGAPSGQNGHTDFRIAFKSASVALAGRRFSLTAIDSAGNTSEFSFSAPYLCDVIFRNGFDDGESDGCPY